MNYAGVTIYMYGGMGHLHWWNSGLVQLSQLDREAIAIGDSLKVSALL